MPHEHWLLHGTRFGRSAVPVAFLGNVHISAKPTRRKSSGSDARRHYGARCRQGRKEPGRERDHTTKRGTAWSEEGGQGYRRDQVDGSHAAKGLDPDYLVH